jgi:membrane protein DedA with SNARE-associated domain
MLLKLFFIKLQVFSSIPEEVRLPFLGLRVNQTHLDVALYYALKLLLVGQIAISIICKSLQNLIE